MNKTLLVNNYAIATICAAVCLSPNKLHATCDATLAKHPPSNTPDNYYGNSQTDSFRCAINGGSDLSSAQLNERASLIPQSVNNRFYIRLGLNASSEGSVGVKNKSTATAISTGIVNENQATTASNNAELALGYTWSDFAIDLEWLALKSVAYNSYLRGITPNIYYYTNVKGDALLANVYWNFKNLYNFNFYGVGLIGTTSNKCTTYLSGGSTNTINKKYSVSYGAGVGARFNIISNVYADMAARYIALGETKFEAASGTTTVTLKGARRWLGMSVRLLWLL